MKALISTALVGLTVGLRVQESDFLSQRLTDDSFFANNQKLFVGYFQSWSEKWSSTGTDTQLANLPAYLNAAIVSFMNPAGSYSGNLALGGTGLDFSSDGSVVKTSIQTLKQRNPNTKVLLAVGGATYTNWAGLNEQAIAQVVADFGFDGVDVDYEPSNPGCTNQGGQVTCASDAEFENVVSRIRAALPSPYLVTLAGWSVGAYGQGDYVDAQPAGSAYTGLCVNLLKSQAGQSLDWINVMSYDASSALDPTQAYQAYKSLYNGDVVIGVEVPPEAWGGHVLTMDEVNRYADFVNNNGGAGMMLWSIQKPASGDISATGVGQAICNAFGLEQCDQPLIQ